uniref:Uncharacterized protein n=1 Tax=Anopheles culicifacies TaxID=139723 RepID=A0A182MH78_9DIPT
MSSNPCKHGDREKDQNNNFVNSTAHGGAGVDREARARRIASRSAREDLHQQMFRGGARNQQHYYNLQHQQQQTGGVPRGDKDTTASTACNGAGSQVTAKVMWGNVSAIKELRDQDQNERQLGTRATGRRHPGCHADDGEDDDDSDDDGENNDTNDDVEDDHQRKETSAPEDVGSIYGSVILQTKSSSNAVSVPDLRRMPAEL